MRRLILILPLVLFLGLAAAFAVPLLKGSNPHDLPSVLIDRPAPDFAAPPLDPGLAGVGIADLKGRVSLVNFFASWCAPCLAEHPVLTRLAATGGVALYGINHKDQPADARQWLARNGDPFTRIGTDADGRIAIDWGVYGVPETFVVDAAGRIRYRHAGPLTPDLVEREIMPLLEALAAAPAGAS